MVFHWILNDSKSPQVFRTFLSILADLNNSVVWMVSPCPLISKSPSHFTNTLWIVPGAQIITGIMSPSYSLIIIITVIIIIIIWLLESFSHQH